MFRIQKVCGWVLCALLSIVFCVIITGSKADNGKSFPVQGLSDRPILILDPGHGGMDGGAVSVTGTRESALNWQITDRIYDLSRFMGLETIRTRPEEGIDYPAELKSISAKKKWDTRKRVELANNTGECFLVSIHQNFFPSPGPRGVQVIFRNEPESAALADILQKQLSRISPAAEKRHAVRAGKEIFLMNHVTVPAVLVECGFLSNSPEALLLEAPFHQKKIAMIIASVYYNFTGDETV